MTSWYYIERCSKQRRPKTKHVLFEIIHPFILTCIQNFISFSSSHISCAQQKILMARTIYLGRVAPSSPTPHTYHTREMKVPSRLEKNACNHSRNTSFVVIYRFLDSSVFSRPVLHPLNECILRS